MNKTIAILPGDGIGPEVMQQALRVLQAIEKRFDHHFKTIETLVGGAAYDVHQSHFPAETLKICQSADAILFGSVGGSIDQSHLDKWRDCEKNSILAVRKAFQFSSNFRPAFVYPELKTLCPLKPEVIGDGIDILIVRELVGDIYFGEHKTFTENDLRVATDIARYDEAQIKSVAHSAFQAAKKRRGKLCSVDKANVLDTSKLWREVVAEVAKDYPEVSFDNMLVDNCAMQLIKAPTQFDVIVTANLFGDILSDAAATLPGSLGMMPSASLNQQGFGLYEPSGGSAPDLTGKNLANPIAQILCVAMMLKFSFSLTEEAEIIEKAVQQVLKQNIATQDIMTTGKTHVGTTEMTDAIIKEILS